MPHKRTGRIADTAAMNAFGTAPDVYPTGLYLRISGEEAAKGEKLNNQRDLLLSFVKTKTELKLWIFTLITEKPEQILLR